MDEQTTIGKDFGGAVRYLFAGRRDQPSDKRAEILASKGVNTNSVAEMIADFELGRDLNPRLNLAVWHTSLSFNPDDEARMSNDRMRAIAETYLKKMGLDNTQYIVVRHRDRPDHHHLHIVANRVDNAGKSIADGNEFFRSNQVLKELVKEYGLTPPGKPRLALQHPERFRPIDLARHTLRTTLNPAVRQETQWPQLLATLKEEKINSKLHYNQAGEATGISFEKDGYCFKGSALGPHLSFAGIDKQLAENELKQRAGAMVLEGTVVHAARPVEVVITANETLSASVTETESSKAPAGQGLLETRALNATAVALSDPAASEKLGAVNQEVTTESTEHLAQAVTAVAAYQQEKNQIANYEAQAGKADRENEIARMLELKSGTTPAAKQGLTPHETEANSTAAGGELLTGLNDLQPDKVQNKESGLSTEGLAATAPISETQMSSSPAVEPVVFVEVLPSLPVGPRHNIEELAPETVTPSLVPAGADTLLPSAPMELLVISLGDTLVPAAPVVAEPSIILSSTQSTAPTELEQLPAVVSHPMAAASVEGRAETTVVSGEANNQLLLAPTAGQASSVSQPEQNVLLSVPAGVMLPPLTGTVDPPAGAREALALPADPSLLGHVGSADRAPSTSPVEDVTQSLLFTAIAPEVVSQGEEERKAEQQAVASALVGMERKLAFIAAKTREADQAERAGDYGLVAELRFDLIVRAQHELAAHQKQAGATAEGRIAVDNILAREQERLRIAIQAEAGEQQRLAEQRQVDLAREAADAARTNEQRRADAAMAAWQQAQQQVTGYRTQLEAARERWDYGLVGTLRNQKLPGAEREMQRCEVVLRKMPGTEVHVAQIEAYKKDQLEQARAAYERQELAKLEKFRGLWPYAGTHIRLQVPAEYLPEVRRAVGRNNSMHYDLEEHADKTTSARVVDGKVAINVLYRRDENEAKLDDALREFRKNGVEVFEQPADRTKREERAANARTFEQQYAEKMRRSNALPGKEKERPSQLEM
jgi:Relaxase/Mobilisation nuclease domain